MGYDEDGEAVFVLQSPEILDQLGCIITFLHLHAQDGDIVVLAGKGHEDYQEIRGVKHHMDERELIAEIIRENPDLKL